MASNTQKAVVTTKRFSVADSQIVRASEEEQTLFKSVVASGKNYTNSEKTAIEIRTPDEFTKFWKRTNSAKDAFDKRHESGLGLVSKTYQNSAAAAGEFMHEFAPIINIVKDFAAPYGGMAIGILSTLFMVAMQKNDTEQRLESTLSAIRDRLPGLAMYQHIYNDNHELDIMLQGRIVLAYQAFVKFCIAAIKYYKGSGIRRWLKAAAGWTSVLGEAERVQMLIVEIRRHCDELLDKKVHSIEQTVIRLESKIGQLLKSEDEHRINEVRRLLSVSTFSDETHRSDFRKYRAVLESDEQLNAPYFEQMQGPALESFTASDEYQSWIQAKQSSLLLLSGHNDVSIAGVDQCWLSPIAVSRIAELVEQTEAPLHAYYLFPQRGALLYQALSVILIQLLQQKSEALRHKARFDELMIALHDLQEEKPSDDRDEKLISFNKLLLRVMEFFSPQDEVFIIIDRADRCHDLRNGLNHRKALLKSLVMMVEAAKCKLKVLVVISGNQWKVEERRDELGVKEAHKVIVHALTQKVIV